MFRPSNPPRRPRPRRGAILIVVLALLALFAVIGISFVFYADSEANAARIHREGQGRSEPIPPDVTQALNEYVLGPIIFDTNDLTNPLRGHSLMRSMYGWGVGAGQHTVPFNGAGLFHAAVDLSATFGIKSTDPNYPVMLPDQARVVNFTTLTSGGTGSFNFDPEKSGFSGTPSGTQRHYVGKNAPYTYPDLNNFYLAVVSPATGEVLAKSFHRDWLFNGVFSPNGTPDKNGGTQAGGNPIPELRLAPYNPSNSMLAGNTDWISVEGRSKILRPRPIDQLTRDEILSVNVPYPVPFDIAYNTSNSNYDQWRLALATLINQRIAEGKILPYPPPNGDGSYTGDVQNYLGGVGAQRNDSILIDVGAKATPWNGRYVVPLFAIMIQDTDGRVSMMSGNVLGSGTGLSHASSMGNSLSEVNPRRVMDPSPNPTGNAQSAAADVEARALVMARYLNAAYQPRSTATSAFAFDRSNQRLPAYSQVNWSGSGGAFINVTMPNFTTTPPSAFRTVPVYGAGYGDNISNAGQATNHPGLYNPAEWPALPLGGSNPLSGRSFARLDLRRMAYQFAPGPASNSVFEAGQFAPTFLRGPAFGGIGYRTDVSHPVRAMLTPWSATLDMPGMMPNTLDYAQPNGPGGGVSGLRLYRSGSGGAPAAKIIPQPGPYPYSNQETNGKTPFANERFGQPMPDPTTLATISDLSDFGSTGNNGTAPFRWRNEKAALGPVDLNRPLGDYRTNPLLPLSPKNPDMTTALGQTAFYQAWADRHNLAKDIFARLIIATGAAADVDPVSGNVRLPQSTGPGVFALQTFGGTTKSKITQEQYDALRYLAQVAVNIVDYIDKDDINTPFLWNPSIPADNLTTQPYAQLTTVTPTALALHPYTTQTATIVKGGVTADFETSQLGNRAVYGTEKPRLVINEAYAEVTNDPNETAKSLDDDLNVKTKFYSTAQYRFWVELLNPTSGAYGASVTDTLGTGSAQLVYDASAGELPLAMGYPTSYPAYRLAIAPLALTGGTGQNLQYALNAAQDNVTGGVPSGTAPPIDYGFADVNLNNDRLTRGINPIVDPNGGTYNPQGVRTGGIVVVGPQLPPSVPGGLPGADEFNPQNPVNKPMGGVFQPWKNMIASGDPVNAANPGVQPPVDSMRYSADPKWTTAGVALPDAATLAVQTRPHAVMLRRLANPYMPPNDPAYNTPGITHNSKNSSTPTYNRALPANPYITVDYMSDVPAHDAVQYARDTDSKNARTDNGKAGYMKVASRFAVGKIQPYAGYAPPISLPEQTKGGGPALGYVPTWSQFVTHFDIGTGKNELNTAVQTTGLFSCVIQQDPNLQNQDRQLWTDPQPKHTFGSHNGRNDGLTKATPAPTANTLFPANETLTPPLPALLNTSGTATTPGGGETIAAPFDWLVHMDRPLANQMELYFVRATKPHLATQRFWWGSSPRAWSGNAAQPLLPALGYAPAKEEGLVPWFKPEMTLDNGNAQPPQGVHPPNPPVPAPPYTEFAYNQTGHGMYRALEMLRLRPAAYGVPAGGKVHGKVNINTLMDYRVLLALLDPSVNMMNGGNGNVFDVDDVRGAATDLWNRVIATRSPNMATRYQPDATAYPVTVPGPTQDEVGYAGTAPFLGALPTGSPMEQVDVRTGLWKNPYTGSYTTLQGAAARPDRPFRSFGGPEFGPGNSIFAGGGTAFKDGSNPNSAFQQFGPGVKDTLMRTFPDPSAAINPTGHLQVPRLWLDPRHPSYLDMMGNPLIDRTPVFFRSDAARKLMNNVTTVSNTFTVTITVVFHEVRMDPVKTWEILSDPVTGRPLLGKEAYRDVPGDLRQQYFAVVDRTNATINPQATTSPGQMPFFTTLESVPVPPNPAATPPQPNYTITVAVGEQNLPVVYADGVGIPINVGDFLYIGAGTGTNTGEREQVQVQTVSAANGIATLGVLPTQADANGNLVLTKAHGVGSLVTNAVLGNPGPQSGFRYWLPQYRPVVPLVVRVR